MRGSSRLWSVRSEAWACALRAGGSCAGQELAGVSVSYPSELSGEEMAAAAEQFKQAVAAATGVDASALDCTVTPNGDGSYKLAAAAKAGVPVAAAAMSAAALKALEEGFQERAAAGGGPAPTSLEAFGAAGAVYEMS